MKKAINVNIGGLVFHLDEDAYEKTQNYLQTLRNYFKNSEGHEEIMQDIEARMAEIFKDRLVNNGREAVNMSDVEHMTGIMGKPEDYLEQEPEGPKEEKEEAEAGAKRLYRDPDNKVVGGVCGGLGAYFGIDPVIFRVIFGLCFVLWGVGFAIYLILWIAMPKAHTTAEKLQMKGEKINISNIERSVKEEFESITKNKGKIAGTMQEMFDSLGKALGTFFRVIGKLIGVAFMLFALVLIVIFIHGMFYNGSVITHNNVRTITTSGREWLSLIVDNSSDLLLSMFGLSLVIFIPLLALVYSGVKIIFSIRQRSKWIGIAFGAFWFIGVLICLYEGLRVGEAFRFEERVVNEQVIPLRSGQTLFLRSERDADTSVLRTYSKDYWGRLLPLERVDFTIVRNDRDSLIRLEITRYAHGRTGEEAHYNAQHINYTITQMDSALIFSPDFILSFEEKFRNQHIELELRIPDGQKVYLDRSIHRIIDDVDNVHHMWDYDMLGKIWTMQKEGLTCTSCTPAEIDKAQKEYDDMMGRYNHYDDDGDSNHHPQPAK